MFHLQFLPIEFSLATKLNN